MITCTRLHGVKIYTNLTLQRVHKGKIPVTKYLALMAYRSHSKYQRISNFCIRWNLTRFSAQNAYPQTHWISGCKGEKDKNQNLVFQP
jgi:hypothetical protein